VDAAPEHFRGYYKTPFFALPFTGLKAGAPTEPLFHGSLPSPEFSASDSGPCFEQTYVEMNVALRAGVEFPAADIHRGVKFRQLGPQKMFWGAS
jgi:hypothetical protein